MSEAQNGGNVMERLTYRDKDGFPMMKKRGGFKQGGIERLAAYEDTRLEPEEIDMDHEAAEQLRQLCRNCDLDRLEKLAEADKDGRLAVLPCKDWLEVVFGDQVLFWGIDKDYVEQPIREISLDDADRIGWYDGYKTVFLKGTDENGEAWEFYPEEIGKTVFLTREEAKRALEAMKDGN